MNSPDYSPLGAAGQGTSGFGDSPRRERAARAAVLVLGFVCGGTAVLDMDFHWHLALGQGLVARGFPGAEPFSHLPVGVPDRQAWLADVMFAVLDRIGGVALIRIAVGAVFAAGCLSVLRLARRRTASVALALVPTALYFALSMARLRVRPDIVTLALLPLFLELLERPAVPNPSKAKALGSSSARRALGLFAASALWANLHPGSLIGGLLALAQLWPLSKLRVVNATATWAGLCLTPDGVHGLLGYAADTTLLRQLIPEWQRIWERPYAEFSGEWTVVGVVVGMSASALFVRVRFPPAVSARAAARGPAVQVREAARALLGFLLAASAVRFLFALVLPALWAVRILSPVVAPRRYLRTVAFAGAVAVLIAYPGAHLRGILSGLQLNGISFLGSEPPAFPIGPARFLVASELSGNLAHPARWGGYLAWKLPPRFKTATDGRVTHFGFDLAREWSLGIDSPARDSIFAKRGIDLVVIPREMLSTFHDDQPYEPIYSDSLAVVLLRLEGPNQAENVWVLQQAAKKRR